MFTFRPFIPPEGEGIPYYLSKKRLSSTQNRFNNFEKEKTKVSLPEI
jgi:hypothetical protein